MCAYTIVAPPGMVVSLNLVDITISCPTQGSLLNRFKQTYVRRNLNGSVNVICSVVCPANPTNTSVLFEARIGNDVTKTAHV